MEQIREFSNSLVQLEIWVIISLIVASMVWLQLLPAAIGIAAVFWLIRWVASGKPSVRTPGDWAIIAIVPTLFVTLWVTTGLNITLIQIYRLLSGIALFYAIANWGNSQSRLHILVFGVVLATLLLALSAPFSVEWSAGKLFFVPDVIYQKFILLVTDTVHPNVLAGSLVIMLSFPIGLIIFCWKERHWFERGLLIVSSLAGLGVVFLTQSRGAWIALAVLLSFMIIFRWRWGWLLIVILSGIAIMFVWRAGTTSVLDFLMTSQSIGSFDDRIHLWSRGIYILSDFPFTGIGMGQFTEITHLLYPYLIPEQIMSHAHNLFLQIAIDLGLLGLIAWLAIWFTIIAASWQLYRKSQLTQDNMSTAIGAALMSSQAALLAHGLLDAVTWGMVRPAPLVWGIWGIGVAAWYVQKISAGAPST